MVKNPPSNAGDAGSIPGQGTKIPPAAWRLSPCATITEPRTLEPAPQPESLRAATTEPVHSKACTTAREPACHNY